MEVEDIVEAAEEAAADEVDADVVSVLYCIALKQPRNISLVVTHCTVDVRVTSDRPVSLGLVPVELSNSISGIHAATYVVNSYIS